MERKDTPKRFGALAAILLLFAAALVWLVGWGGYVLEVDRIKVEINNLPDALVGMKIAHISDVHLPRNIPSIDSILRAVAHEKPDVIVITGDALDGKASMYTCGLDRLCKGLSDIAPTYAVAGNHELRHSNIDALIKIFTDNHVRFLLDEAAIFSYHEAQIAIAGIHYSTPFVPSLINGIEQADALPLILLAHSPQLFPSYSSASNDIVPDLVLSGHAHGGQFRIPFTNQGIVAPNQGFFPRYTSGLYQSENGVQMVVSRGLGNSIIPIRVNDRPHLPIVELTKSK